jgi:hypothetical protein
MKINKIKFKLNVKIHEWEGAWGRNRVDTREGKGRRCEKVVVEGQATEPQSWSI